MFPDSEREWGRLLALHSLSSGSPASTPDSEDHLPLCKLFTSGGRRRPRRAGVLLVATHHVVAQSSEPVTKHHNVSVEDRPLQQVLLKTDIAFNFFRPFANSPSFFY